MSEVVSIRNWATEIRDLYAEGASDAEVAAHCNITVKDFYKQMQDIPALAQLVDFGRTLSMAFWEKQARKNIDNKQFNTSLWAFYMKNKFGWADKTESVNTNEMITGDLDTLRSELMKQVERFIRKNTPELTDAQRVLKQLGMVTEEDLADE